MIDTYIWDLFGVFLREEPNVGFADNNRYSLAKIVDPGTFQNIQTKDNDTFNVHIHIMNSEQTVRLMICLYNNFIMYLTIKIDIFFTVKVYFVWFMNLIPMHTFFVWLL